MYESDFGFSTKYEGGFMKLVVRMDDSDNDSFARLCFRDLDCNDNDEEGTFLRVERSGDFLPADGGGSTDCLGVILGVVGASNVG